MTIKNNLESFINAQTLMPMANNFNLDKQKYNTNSINSRAILNSNNFFITEFSKLQNVATSSFSYTNLPNEIPESYIEYGLFEGQLVYFVTEDGTSIISKFSVADNDRDHYGRLKSVTLKSNSDTLNSKKIKVSNDITEKDTNYGVVISGFSNPDSITPQFKALQTASFLAKITQGININLTNISRPLVAVTTPKNKKSVQDFYDKVEMGEPLILALKTLAGEDISKIFKQFNVNTTYYGEQLMGLYNDRMNEYLSFMGINNASIAKRERNTVDEVNSNNQSISLVTQNQLTARKESFDVINERFKQNIKVDFNPEVLELATNMMLSKDSDNLKVDKSQEDKGGTSDE